MNTDYATMPVVEVIERLLALIYECPLNDRARYRLESIRDGIFLELPEARIDLLCQVGRVINEHVPSGVGNHRIDEYWYTARDIMQKCFAAWKRT